VRRIPYGSNLGFLDRTSLEHSHKLLNERNYKKLENICVCRWREGSTYCVTSRDAPNLHLHLKTSSFLVFRIPHEWQSPQTQRFWTLYTNFRTFYNVLFSGVSLLRRCHWLRWLMTGKWRIWADLKWHCSGMSDVSSTMNNLRIVVILSRIVERRVSWLRQRTSMPLNVILFLCGHNWTRIPLSYDSYAKHLA
jgi:hypothetical protein